jgi:hypothetical protein
MSFIYVATPFRSYPGGMEEAFRAAARFTAHLVDQGVEVYSPIAHTWPIAQHTRCAGPNSDFWLVRQKPFLRAARGLIVAMMPGWDTSEGIKFERNWFEAAQKPEWLMPDNFDRLPEDLQTAKMRRAGREYSP